MTGPTCPAEGCDYNENGEKSKQSVRRHINAKTDDAHSDTEALRSALNRPAEGDDEGAEQGAQGAPDDTEDDEQGARKLRKGGHKPPKGRDEAETKELHGAAQSGPLFGPPEDLAPSVPDGHVQPDRPPEQKQAQVAKLAEVRPDHSSTCS